MKVVRGIVYALVGLVVLFVAFSATMHIEQETAAAVAPAVSSIDDSALIREKRIRIGMDEASLVKSWGKPQSINTHTSAQRERKQYVYGDGQYVYVTDGVISSISQQQ